MCARTERSCLSTTTSRVFGFIFPCLAASCAKITKVTLPHCGSIYFLATMGNSKSILAHEQAVLEAAIKESRSSEFREPKPRKDMNSSDGDIDAAMIAVMNGEGGPEVLQKISEYNERRRSSLTKPRRSSSVSEESRPSLDKSDHGPPREISFELKSPASSTGSPDKSIS